MTLKFLDDAFLDEMRKHKDPKADDLVSNFLKIDSSETIENEGADYLSTLLRSLHDNNDKTPHRFPEILKEYFDSTKSLPDWADINQIEIGQKVFIREGFNMVLAYFLKSLPQCYACAKGAEVLLSTGRLTSNVRRRIAKTAQFVMDVLTPGGLESDGEGIVTTQKVRLIHASIRYYLTKQKSIDFDIYGQPINQEDIAGTFLAFTVLVIQGAELLGSEFTNEEKNAYLHCWKCITYILGLNTELMPDNYEDAVLFWEKIKERQYASSPQGIELTRSLIDFLEEIVPGKSLDGFISGMVIYLVDKDAVKLLELKATRDSRNQSYIGRILLYFVTRIANQSYFSKQIAIWLNQRILNALERYIAEGHNVQFVVPNNLKSNWMRKKNG
jgi:hypothetical protein